MRRTFLVWLTAGHWQRSLSHSSQLTIRVFTRVIGGWAWHIVSTQWMISKLFVCVSWCFQTDYSVLMVLLPCSGQQPSWTNGLASQFLEPCSLAFLRNTFLLFLFIFYSSFSFNSSTHSTYLLLPSRLKPQEQEEWRVREKRKEWMLWMVLPHGWHQARSFTCTTSF